MSIIDGHLVATFDAQATWWMADAACRDLPDEWHPEMGDDTRRRLWVAQFFPDRGASLEAARLICARCPVRAECRQHALDTGERHGVWGGGRQNVSAAGIVAP